MTSGPDLGELPASEAPWSSAMPPSLGRGRVINNNNNKARLPIMKNKANILEMRVIREVTYYGAGKIRYS